MILRTPPGLAFDPRVPSSVVEADDFRFDPSYPDARTERGAARPPIIATTDK